MDKSQYKSVNLNNYLWLIVALIFVLGGLVGIIFRYEKDKKVLKIEGKNQDWIISGSWMFKERIPLTGVVIEVFLSGEEKDIEVLDTIEKLKDKVGHNLHEIIYLPEDQKKDSFVKERIKLKRNLPILIDGKFVPERIDHDSLFNIWIERQLRQKMLLTHYIIEDIEKGKIKYEFEGCNSEFDKDFEGEAIIIIVEDFVDYLGKKIDGVFRKLILKQNYKIPSSTCHQIISEEINIPENCTDIYNLRLIFIEKDKNGEFLESCCSGRGKKCSQHKESDYYSEYIEKGRR